MVITERTRIRMTAALAGMAMPSYGINHPFAHSEGDTPEVHRDLAAAWIKNGQAEPIKETPKATK